MTPVIGERCQLLRKACLSEDTADVSAFAAAIEGRPARKNVRASLKALPATETAWIPEIAQWIDLGDRLFIAGRFTDSWGNRGITRHFRLANP